MVANGVWIQNERVIKYCYVCAIVERVEVHVEHINKAGSVGGVVVDNNGTRCGTTSTALSIGLDAIQPGRISANVVLGGKIDLGAREFGERGVQVA